MKTVTCAHTGTTPHITLPARPEAIIGETDGEI